MISLSSASRAMALIGSISLLVSGLIAEPAAPRATPEEQKINRKLDRLRVSPSETYAFLLKMPKGGDLHHHLAGGAYAEDLINAAAAEGLCIDTGSWSFVSRTATGACETGQLPAKEALDANGLRNHLIDSLSMRDFVPVLESAHDHFFAAFGKFQAIGREANGEFLAQVIRRAAEQNESYLELMALAGGTPVAAVAKRTTFSGDLETLRSQLMAGGLPEAVTEMKKQVDELEQKRLQLLGCETAPATAPCRVAVQYIFRVLREFPREQVFAQMLTGFVLAAEDNRVVSINLVQPEDGVVSIRDYHLHMQMLKFLRSRYPKVPLTLHAGELALGLVPPEDLRFHIQEAVDIARAERIGHGVDINYELQPEKLLQRMKERHVAVEINLTSNDVILGVRGNDHPLPTYRKYGVPVVLCTDDEGVSRTHLTEEYLRATLAYKLSYTDLKELVRNSLEYSFLRGSSLWKENRFAVTVDECTAGRAGPRCQAYLRANPKARLQADLEDRFEVFEREF